jgi:hypothetical protein
MINEMELNKTIKTKESRKRVGRRHKEHIQ